MKKLFIVLLIVSLPLIADIGNRFYLGYTVYQVKRMCGKPIDENKNFFYYSTKYYGINGHKAFFHYKNRIFETIFMLSESYSVNTVVTNYLNIQKGLDDKYGVFENRNQWTNNTFKNYKNYFLTALQVGHVKIVRLKTVGKYTIIHMLYYNNYKPQHTIHYIDTARKKAYSEYEDKKNRNGI